MKKAFCFSISFLLVSTLLFSVTIHDAETSKYFKIQGASGAVIKATVSPISTQATSFIMGMPFDIEDDLVQYGVMQHGRAIANWSLVTNTSFLIKIKADLLASNNTYYDGTNNVKCYLPYYLKFGYNFGYFDSNGSSQSESAECEIDNERGIAKYTYPNTGLTTEKGVSADGYISFQFLSTGITSHGISGSVDGEIYFMFTESSSHRILNSGSTVPVGEYSAEVTIVLESL